jgi:hypothetical protein
MLAANAREPNVISVAKIAGGVFDFGQRMSEVIPSVSLRELSVVRIVQTLREAFQ